MLWGRQRTGELSCLWVELREVCLHLFGRVPGQEKRKLLLCLASQGDGHKHITEGRLGFMPELPGLSHCPD